MNNISNDLLLILLQHSPTDVLIELKELYRHYSQKVQFTRDTYLRLLKSTSTHHNLQKAYESTLNAEAYVSAILELLSELHNYSKVNASGYVPGTVGDVEGQPGVWCSQYRVHQYKQRLKILKNSNCNAI
jgi:hypothetical protein